MGSLLISQWEGFLIVTMSTAISLSIPHPPRGIIAANHTPLLKTQVLEEKYSPLPLPTPQKLVTHLQHVESGSASPRPMMTTSLDLRICSRDSAGWIRVLQGQGYFHGDRREIQRTLLLFCRHCDLVRP